MNDFTKKEFSHLSQPWTDKLIFRFEYRMLTVYPALILANPLRSFRSKLIATVAYQFPEVRYQTTNVNKYTYYLSFAVGPKNVHEFSNTHRTIPALEIESPQTNQTLSSQNQIHNYNPDDEDGHSGGESGSGDGDAKHTGD